MREITIKFRYPIDTEELRECIEDNLGVEILEIEHDDYIDDGDDMEKLTGDKLNKVVDELTGRNSNEQ